MSDFLLYLIPLVAAFVVATLLAPSAIKLSFANRVVSQPGGRRRHSRPVAKLGGVPIFVGYLIGIGLIYFIFPPQGYDIIRLRGVVLGSLVMFIGGLIDDRYDLNPLFQFAIQFAGAAIAIGHIVFIEIFTNPFSGELEPISKWLAIIVTLVWIVGIINVVNWMDGLDGLAAGVGIIAVGLFAWHSRVLGQEAVAAFPLALAGALIGLLLFNFPPAKLFLGSAGAYVLGYNLATLAILSPAKIATALLVLAIPIIDGIWRVVDRLRRRRNPFQGDRGHLHYLLTDRGIPTWKIVTGYYVASLTFGLVAIFASGMAKVIVLAVLAAGLVLLLVLVSSDRLLAAPQKVLDEESGKG